MSRRKLPDKNFEWNSDLAYAVGLLVTDGNLSKNGRTIILRSCDLDQIEAFRLCLHASNKIEAPPPYTQYGKKICYRIQIGNVQLYRWLLTIGLFPAKTHTIGALKIPNGFFRDFLRGHLDGDGSVVSYIDQYNKFKNPKYVYTRLWIKFISASETHIIWLRAKISELLNIKGHLSKLKPRETKNVGIWQLKFGKTDSMKLFNWMYYGRHIPHLTRKRKKFEQAIAIIQATKRKSHLGRPPITA